MNLNGRLPGFLAFTLGVWVAQWPKTKGFFSVGRLKEVRKGVAKTITKTEPK